jgi:hypothetical protein
MINEDMVARIDAAIAKCEAELAPLRNAAERAHVLECELHRLREDLAEALGLREGLKDQA